ncbi:MAG: tRNA glutamyl-Q(34) synthetase GluQRS [Gammaproteobacteria bacterium]
MNTAYRGRFAPTPSGPLHFGSLVSAVCSYLDARSSKGVWLVRIEDLDPPRTQPGMADHILKTLENFGLHWDETVIYQSQRTAVYQKALSQLATQDACYPCSCSRKDTQLIAADTAIYPGTCRDGIKAPDKPTAIRFRVKNSIISFQDRLAGQQTEPLDSHCGDFIIRRSDHLYAYQLAVVVDDHAQNITHIVRGHDLLDNTCRQIALQQALGFHTPRYLHHPLVMGKDGKKLSKQNLAPAVNDQQKNRLLFKTLRFLGQQPPGEIERESIPTMLQWATENWAIEKTRNPDQVS